MRVWAVKSTALACENFMLAMRAHGFDSCPMEGYDAVRVSKIINLPCGAEPMMVFGCGKRKVGGVFGRRFRLPSSQFIKIIE
jgi:nitroreductase